MFLSGAKAKAKVKAKAKTSNKKNSKKKGLKKKGGFATHLIHHQGDNWACEKLTSLEPVHSSPPSPPSPPSVSGGDQPTTPSSVPPPVITGGGALKKMFKKELNKMTKEKLMKKCKKYGIKITTKKNGVIKPIKKETLVNKIVAAKFK